MKLTTESMIDEFAEQPYLGPMRSQSTPITRRERMLPETEAIPALEMSARVRLRLSRMMGTRGQRRRWRWRKCRRKAMRDGKLSCGVVLPWRSWSLQICFRNPPAEQMSAKASHWWGWWLWKPLLFLELQRFWEGWRKVKEKKRLGLISNVGVLMKRKGYHSN